jgi:hypothetical protein
MECKDCNGSGLIMRMVSCCTNGCAVCRGDRYIINPVWKKYRKIPIVNQEIFQCSICLSDVQPNAEKYVLHCKH